MNNTLRNILPATAALALFLLAPAASSQNADIKVHLPVKARIGQTVLPAGEYFIRQMDSDPALFSVDSDQGLHLLVPAMRIFANTKIRTSKAELILTQQGDEYRVSQILIGGSGYGYEFLPLDRQK